MAFPGLKEDYPQKTTDANGIRRIYLYQALSASLFLPAYKTIYDGHPVESATLNQLGLTSWSELRIETLEKAPGESGGEQTSTSEGTDGTSTVPPPAATGPATEVTDTQYPYYEIDWVQVEKSLRQHPAFAEFTPGDWTAIDFWEKETDTEAKAGYQYYNHDKDGASVGTVQTLDTASKPDKSPQKYAQLRLLGVESFIDFAPVARKTSRFRGNQSPDTEDAGQKAGGDPFAGVPSDYQWLKTADRSSKQGAGGVEWLRQEEWTGAREILLDKDTIYLA